MMHKGRVVSLFSIGAIVILGFLLNRMFGTWRTPLEAGDSAETSEADSLDERATAAPTRTGTPLLTETITTTDEETPTRTATATRTPMNTSTAIPATATVRPRPASTKTPSLGVCTGTPLVEQLTLWPEPILKGTTLGFINPGEVYTIYAYVDNGRTLDFHTKFYQINYQGSLVWTIAVYMETSGDCSGIVLQATPSPTATETTELHSESWTLISEYISSDQCSGAATGNVTVPVTLSFDAHQLLVSLSWYDRYWTMYTRDAVNYSGSTWVENTDTEQIQDNVRIIFTSPDTFEGDLYRSVTRSDGTECAATYKWHGSR